MDLLAIEARAMMGRSLGKQLVTVAKTETGTVEGLHENDRDGFEAEGAETEVGACKGCSAWLHAGMGPGRGCREVEEGCR